MKQREPEQSAENTQRDIKGLKVNQAPGSSSATLRLGGGSFPGNALVLGYSRLFHPIGTKSREEAENLQIDRLWCNFDKKQN